MTIMVVSTSLSTISEVIKVKEIIFEDGDLLFVRSDDYDINTFPLPKTINPLDVGCCKYYVRQHRNPFDIDQKLYTFSALYPITIKEISVAPDGKQRSYWFWLFRKDRYTVIKFKKRPSRNMVEKVIDDIYKFESINKVYQIKEEEYEVNANTIKE